MTDTPEPQDETPRKPDDYEDRHYHDDDDVVAADDVPRGPRPPVRKKLPRRLPPRRRYDED